LFTEPWNQSGISLKIAGPFSLDKAAPFLYKKYNKIKIFQT